MRPRGQPEHGIGGTPTMQKGLTRRTWLPSAHQNQPAYEGWRQRLGQGTVEGQGRGAACRAVPAPQGLETPAPLVHSPVHAAGDELVAVLLFDGHNVVKVAGGRDHGHLSKAVAQDDERQAWDKRRGGGAVGRAEREGAGRREVHRPRAAAPRAPT